MTDHQATRQELKADRRAALVAAATTLMARRGYLGVRLADIGAAAGISGPAIYRHFASKDAVLAEILVGISEQLLLGAVRIEASAAGAEAAVRSLVDQHVEFALRDPEIILIDDRDRAHLPPEASRARVRAQRQYVGIWVDMVACAVPSGDAVADRLRVHAVLGLINSAPRASRTTPVTTTRDVVTGMALASLGLPPAPDPRT